MKAAYFLPVLALTWVPALQADVSLPSVLSSGMVLQRDQPVPVWGRAAAGEKVTVTFSGQTRETGADAQGNWQIKLDPLTANATGQALVITGNNKIELTDVLVGEVWLGSGQSNMEWPISRTENGAAAAAEANFPQIRLFQVPLTSSPEPRFSCNAAWKPCSPETAASFSAVLYYMGRELHRELGVPVGLINSSWGGSRIEPWTPVEGFAMVPSQRDLHRSICAATPGTGEYQNSMKAWLGNVEQWARDSRAALDKGQAPLPIPDKPGPVAQGFQGVVGLFNAMIHPLVPFGLRGAIWYQGESNLGEGMAYLERKKALIGGWRKVWNQGDFPFYTVQLAPFNYGNQPRDKARQGTALPEIWEAQNATLTEIPRTGVAVINDIGDFADIHPANKKEVGRRLSLIALATEYGRTALVHSGPVFAAASPENGKLRVRFTATGSGLATRDGKAPAEFEIAGPDGKFHPAEAVIEGNEVLLSSPAVTDPKQVRHAWNQIPEPNLINKEGLPASAFRTR
jgi:sialate O-acetylesterase